MTLSYIEKDNKKDNNNNVEKIQESSDFKKEKSSKVSAKKTSLPEIEFLDLEFKDFNVFEEYIRQAHPEINTSFYYHKNCHEFDKT